MARRGRPAINIDKSEFEKLCGLQCTLIEIASWFNCSEDTIENFCKREYKRNFSDVFQQKRSMGKISLRRSQFKLAQKNPAMAIWLGKQYLDQREPRNYELDEQENGKKMEVLKEIFQDIKDGN